MSTQSPVGPSKIESFDSILGTVGGQKMLRVLIVWDQLPVKEIIAKTGLSESQTYVIIKNFELLGIIDQTARGIYRLSTNPFVTAMSSAYKQLYKRLIGQELYKLSKNIESLPRDELLNEFEHLTVQWKPLLAECYKSKMSSLANAFLNDL